MVVTIGQIFINIFWISFVVAAYFLIFAFIPFWLRGCKISHGNVFDNLVTSFLISNFTAINVVYFLAFLKIYNAFTLVIGLFVIAFSYLYWFRWPATTARAHSAMQSIILMSEGSYNFKVMWNNLRKGINEKAKFLVGQIIRHPINIAVFILGIGFAAYYRFYSTATQMHFGTSDLYVHVNWIRYLDNNIVFMNGVYPFGFHNILSSFRQLININLVYFIHLMGGVIGISIVISMYFLCKRIFKSSTAANCAFIFYCFSDSILKASVVRQTVALPQEFSMVFVYPCAWFLHKYLCEKNVKDCIYFAVAFALTVSIHFYGSIIAVFLCGGIVIAHFGYLFQGKTFIRLVIVTVLISAMAVAPLGIGLMMGIKWEHSLSWATDVITGEDTEGTGKEANPMPSMEGRTNEDIIMNDYISQITSEFEWFLLFLYMSGFGIVFALIKMLFKKHRAQGALILGVIVYALLLIAAMLGPVFGFPPIMVLARATIFYAYIAPIILMIPIEAVHTLLYRKNLFVRSLYFACAAFISAVLGNHLFVDGHIMRLGTSLRFQYDGAVTTYYKIVNEHPQFNWTIVSPVEETSMVRGDGYHYELRDFLLDMYKVHEKTKLYLPTKYVFIYVEKHPLRFNETIELSNPDTQPSDFVTLDEAKVDLYSLGESVRTNVLFLYNEYEPRRILESKAYYWAKEYEKYFPHEMKIYYEDEQLIVYKITQEMYALNNFAIPYAGNSDTVSGE